MTADLTAARTFVESSARVLERHRLAHLLGEAGPEPVLAALAPYRNADGGYGHGLEPDIRCPGSQPASTLHALDVLEEIGALDDPSARDAVRWLGTVATPDGLVPQVLPGAEAHPHAPWMVPNPDVGFLTYALVAAVGRSHPEDPWVRRATAWCWEHVAEAEAEGGYTVKFALGFLDAADDAERAAAAVRRLRARLSPDGTLPVAGGVDGESIAPLLLAPRPGRPSRGLFDDDRIETELDALEAAQLDDGGWDFAFLHWSAGQAVEWRGITTVEAVATLRAHGRL